jgi:colanic acid/amylovoran biosynthesis glycosyltransferase
MTLREQKGRPALVPPGTSGARAGERPCVVHLVTPYLFHTGSWIYTQLTGMHEFSNVVFTQQKENLEQFPFAQVYSPEDFGLFRRLSNRIYRRTFDRYGLYYTELAQAIRPNLFHAHMGHEGARWLSFVRNLGKPLVTTFYGLDVSKLGLLPEWRRRYRELFAYGAAFCAEGSFLKQQLVNLGCPAHKVIIQHLGIPLSLYPVKTHSPKRPGERIVILQVATFREKKGIAYSLHAIAGLKHDFPHLEFRLVGGGDDAGAEDAIQALIGNLGLADTVRLLGVRSHRETIEEMIKADLFLHPSVTASNGDNEGGAPVGIIEASACGLPVVSTVHADIPEVVVHGTTGLLAAERNVEELVQHMRWLLVHPEQWEAMGRAGRRHVEEQYNTERQIPLLEKIYATISGSLTV